MGEEIKDYAKKKKKKKFSETREERFCKFVNFSDSGFIHLLFLSSLSSLFSLFFLFPLLSFQVIGGSSQVFVTLLERMLATERVAICRLIARTGSEPRFVALLPQV